MKTERPNPHDIEGRQLHLTSRFTSALDYARHLHIERRKETDIPYMAHLLGVAALVMAEAGLAAIPVTEDMVIAALLHDTVEDHGGLSRGSRKNPVIELSGSTINTYRISGIFSL